MTQHVAVDARRFRRRRRPGRVRWRAWGVDRELQPGLLHARWISRSACGVLAACLLAAAAAAQTVPNALPGAAEPGRKVPVAPTPPPLKLRWTLELPAGPAPLEALADETLTLNEVRLDGVTVYALADLRDLFEPYLGKEITLRAFYGIAAAIQARYQADGYLLSFA